MSKKTRQHTAHFLISNFLMSKDSLPFALNGNAQAILRYMGDLMDATYRKSGNSMCKAPQYQVAIFTGTSERTVRTVLRRLVKLEIINQIGKIETNIGLYEIGSTLSVRQNVPECSPATLQSSPAKTTGSSAMVAGQYNTAFNTVTKKGVLPDRQARANEPKQTAKFWELGNPDYDRRHGIKR